MMTTYGSDFWSHVNSNVPGAELDALHVAYEKMVGRLVAATAMHHARVGDNDTARLRAPTGDFVIRCERASRAGRIDAADKWIATAYPTGPQGGGLGWVVESKMCRTAVDAVREVVGTLEEGVPSL